jgi:hypothetical protein
MHSRLLLLNYTTMFFKMLIALCFPVFLNPALIHYQIKKGSKMTLKGNTSVNDFKCECEDNFENSQLIANFIKSSEEIEFSKANLLVKINSLDCKNRFLNDDLAASLRADQFPYIHVEMLTAIPQHQDETLQLYKVYNYQIKTQITISGKTRPQTLNVVIKKINNRYYNISANKAISMAEYNIQPKSPIKFIKIKNEVSIHFDLNVEIQ